MKKFGRKKPLQLVPNQDQVLKPFAFPHLTLQFQDEFKSYYLSLPEKARCLRTLSSSPYEKRAEAAPYHKYILGRNKHEATRVLPQGKASRWTPRAARNGKSQDL